MITQVKDFLKNARGTKTNRKIVVFLVDDYGTIRIASQKALQDLQKFDLQISENRFNKYDELASVEDLSALFEVLTSVKDKNGNSAVFTPMTVVANPDFDAIEKNGFSEYKYETFFETLKRTHSSNAIMELWKEGIGNNIFVPEFHGREHLNVRFWMELLNNKDQMILKAFNHRSIGINPSQKTDKDYMMAFDIQDKKHLEEVIEIAQGGLQIFEELFGYKSVMFTPSALVHNSGMHEELKKNYIEFIDMARQRIAPNLNGKYRKHFHYMGQKNKYGQQYITRNVMFEPNINSRDWVVSALKDINISFQYKKPAIISSHRVNFVGGKSEANREKGLSNLRRLLTQVVQQWPDVEFLSIQDLRF